MTERISEYLAVARSITEEQLADKIERAIRDIPASNPSYISVRQETLSDVMSRGLVRKIAEVAAVAARSET